MKNAFNENCFYKLKICGFYDFKFLTFNELVVAMLNSLKVKKVKSNEQNNFNLRP